MNCRLCNAPLSRYHEARSDLCRKCEVGLRPIPFVWLVELVATIMLEEHATAMAECREVRRPDLRHELERRGWKTTAEERHAAVCRAREEHIVPNIEGEGPHQGYVCRHVTRVFYPRGLNGNLQRPAAEQLRMA